VRSEGLEIHVAMVSPNRETRKAHTREALAAAPISPPARSSEQPHAVDGTAVRNRAGLGDIRRPPHGQPKGACE